ncbi:hypothetical protein ACMWD1_05300 [Gardnerella vaginalis]
MCGGDPHIKPVLGEIALAELSTQMVNEFRDSLDALQPYMVRNTMKILRAIVNSALIVFNNRVGK